MGHAVFLCATAVQVEDALEVAQCFPGSATLVTLWPQAHVRARRSMPDGTTTRLVDLSSSLPSWLHTIVVTHRGRQLIRGLTRRPPLPVFVLGDDLNPPEVAFVKAIGASGAVSVLLQDGLLDSLDPRRITSGPHLHVRAALATLRMMGLCEEVNPFYGAAGTGHVFVYGDATRELLVRQGVTSCRITTTGAPRLDRLFRGRWGKSPAHNNRLRRRRVLCLGLMFGARGWATVDDDRRWMSIVNDMALRNPQWDVVVRPHPADDLSRYRECLAAIPQSALRLDRDTPLYESLDGADAVVASFPSTVLLEAIVLNRPVLFLDIGLDCQHNDYLNEPAIRCVSDPVRLSGEVDAAIADSGGFEQARKAFIARHMGFDDGASGQRVAELLARACE